MIEMAMIGYGGGRGGGFADRRFLASGACISAYQMWQVSGCSEFLSVSGQGFASVRYCTKHGIEQPTNRQRHGETQRKGKERLPFNRSGPA